MAKNEAKIKFTAETGEFNKSIEQANDKLAENRAELKLVETQLKGAGDSVEALEKKHGLLEDQLKASQEKTEALSSKLEKAVAIFGENSKEVSRLRIQLANAKRAEEEAQQAVSKCNNELEKQKGVSNEAKNATAQLTDKIEEQKGEVSRLKREYVDAVLQYGENSKEAKKLAREIEDLSGELKQSESAFSDATQKANKLDKSMNDAGDSARDSGDGFTIAKGAIADLASEAIQMAIGKVSEFVGWLAELPEATRELRQDMATLETSYETAGFTVGEATNTWKDLYTVFGEDDRAVEAANLIAKMSKNQEDLNTWVTITKGVWGSYQDSLPVEGLAEASMESARTGQVTGVLADALNWSSEAAQMFGEYMSEDVTTAEDAFNEALSKCSNEQERQALITDTLTKLYGGAAKTYDEASKGQTEAKEATAENILVQNELAETVEPLTTAWDSLKVELLTGIMPAVKAVSDWGVSALGWMKEHPTTVKLIAAVLGVMATALGALMIVVAAYTVAQWAANAAILACPVTWIVVAVVAAVAAIVAAVILIIDYWDEIVAATTAAWDGIVSACESAWAWVQNIISSFVSWIDTNVIQPIVSFFTNLWTSIQNIWQNICNAVQVAIMFIGSIISAAYQIITLPFRFIWENCKNIVISVFNTVRDFISQTLSNIRSFFADLWAKIQSIFAPVAQWFSDKFNQAKEGIKNAWASVKGWFSNIWNGITGVFSSVGSWFSSKFTQAKSAVTNAWSSVTGWFSGIWSKIKGVFSSVGSWFSDKFNQAKEAITRPIEAAKNKVKSVVDSIKGFFNNMKLKFPNIKLPHFKISGSFSLNPPSVPKLKIDWYAKAMNNPMILNSPTIFGYSNGRFRGAGEAGSEMVGGTNTVMEMIQGAVDRSMQAMNLNALAAAVEDLANRPNILQVNGRQFALATASDADRVNGLRNRIIDRGVLLD